MASGHRRIAFLSGDNPHVSAVAERHRAYREALGEVGAYDAELERWLSKDLEHKPERLAVAMRDAMGALLAAPEPPTALFCVQDLYAVAAHAALAGFGASLETLTFNETPPERLPRHTHFGRIVQDALGIGRRAAERYAEIEASRRAGEPATPRLMVVPARHFPPPSPLATVL